jgi:hypothetical protein
MNLDAKIAHLGFIQGVIGRMASNSFLLKGWSLTLVAALFALSAKDADRRFVFLAYFPVVFFWFLDAYFLHQEKLFRKLYEEVAANRIASEDFSLDTSPAIRAAPGLIRVAVSRTLLAFHMPMLIVVLLATVYLKKA